MSPPWEAGAFVEHAQFGIGKIVYSDGACVHVYFPAKLGSRPADRVAQFADPTRYLKQAAPSKHPELDNLPPWSGKAFDVSSHSFNLDLQVTKFLRLFPGGVDDPGFAEHETEYKRAAHGRWATELAPRLNMLIAARDGASIASALDAVYGDPRAKSNPASRLNLLYQPVEEPAFFSALREGGDATVEYLDAAYAFIRDPGETHFNLFVRSLSALPTRPGGARIDMWTTLTWLPFVVDPEHHIVVKPTIVQAFAASIPFELNYKPELNYLTYRCCVALACLLRDKLERTAINPARRQFDMIDVQSFMWVVERWAKPDKGDSP